MGSENEFSIKITLDGEKLKNAKLGEGKDWVRCWQKIKADKDSRLMTCINYDGEGEPIATSYTRFLEDPLRVEFWLDDKDGRKTGKLAAKLVEAIYINPILHTLKKRRVRVHQDIPSPTTHGKLSCISDALDEYTGYDELYDNMVSSIKKLLVASGAEIKEMDDQNFQSVTKADESLPKMEDGSTYQQIRDVKHDKDSHKIIIVQHASGGDAVTTSFYLFHEDPLIVETYTEDGHSRYSGKIVQVVMQMLIDDVIQGVEKAWM